MEQETSSREIDKSAHQQSENIQNSKLLVDIGADQWPIIYRPEYNVSLCHLEKLHPFDAHKWRNIFKRLKSFGLVSEATISRPNEASEADLLVVHTKNYLNSLKCSLTVAAIVEVLPICIIPNLFVQRSYLRPMRYQVGGSILAGKLALERNWSINLGGGFHHCCASIAGGFCAYADISLLIEFAFNSGKVNKVMIVDLDAHQGNGHARDLGESPDRVYILDVYNADIYPRDQFAKNLISRRVELHSFCEDDVYLELIQRHLSKALDMFQPDLVVYNAGTDVLKGDPLGRLSVTAEGIIQRDEYVFRTFRSRNIPIVMLTSGGYLKRTAGIIADSIRNLHEKQLISGPSD